jgi:hypothetical protein
VKSWIACLIFFPFFVQAAEIGELPPAKNQKALEVVRAIVQTSNAQGRTLLRDLEDLRPEGPAFVDAALKILNGSEDGWKDRKASLIIFLGRVLRGGATWADFEDSDLKESIHQEMQKVLAHFPNSGTRQEAVVLIFQRLNLWSESDLPFLAKCVVAGSGAGAALTEPFIRIFSKADHSEQRKYADRLRSPKEFVNMLVTYALLNRARLSSPRDTVWLIRLMMEDAAEGGGRSLAQAHREEDELWATTVLDLYERLQDGEPVATKAYNQVIKKPQWSRRHFFNEELERGMRFLRDLKSGQLLRCADYLHVTSNKTLNIR